MHKVSIIIPCYNVDNHLSKCIDSVLAQTYKDFELILINDGSTDSTGKISDEYAQKDNRICVYHKINGGVSSARNFGIEKAVGDVILFIDGDDYIKDDYIEQLLKNYEEGNWPICGMVNVRNHKLTDNKNFQKLLQLYPKKQIQKYNFMDLLIYDCFSSPCARLYSTKIIQEKRIRYDESVTYQEDLLFNLEYIKYVECAKLMDYLGYYYIEHEVSSTGRFHNKFNHIDLLQNKLLHYIRNDNDSRALKYFILQTILRKISNTFHYKSPYSKRHKIFELKQILESESFDFSQDYIDNLQINIFLKKIIKFKSSLLIYVYFQMIHKKN